MPDSPVIETRNLRKTWGQTQALRGLDLRVSSGSIHAFLGRNGAGKTTALKILLGMARPDGGESRVFGLDSANPRQSVEIRGRAGFISEEKELYEEMTVEEMIRFTRAFYPRWRRDLENSYLSRFGLSRAAGVKTLSRGGRTRLAVLLSFCRGAELLLLDEPTAGLDPAAAEDVLQAIVSHVAAEGMTVFFSSHQIHEVEQIADRITILTRGRNVLSGGLDELREKWRRIHLTFDGEAPHSPLHPDGLISIRAEGRTLTLLCCENSERILREVQALQPVSVNVLPVSLKEIFVHYSAEENENAAL